MAKVAGLTSAPAKKVTFGTFIRGLPVALKALPGKNFFTF